MKKISLLSIVFLALFSASSVLADPVFSSALGGGTSYGVRVGNINRYNEKGQTNILQKKVVKPFKTVLRYQPSETSLNEEHRALLAKIVDRYNNGQVFKIELVGINRDESTTSENYHRLRQVLGFFEAYIPGIKIKSRYVMGSVVFDTNDNTVEILEYR